MVGLGHQELAPGLRGRDGRDAQTTALAIGRAEVCRQGANGPLPPFVESVRAAAQLYNPAIRCGRGNETSIKVNCAGFREFHSAYVFWKAGLPSFAKFWDSALNPRQPYGGSAVEFDEATLKFNQIFQPGLIEERMAILAEQKRFVYYTSADTAMKVLRNQELWFRNATVMNDYSEISYGLRLIGAVFSGPEGERFRTAVEDIFPDTIEKAAALLSGWERDWRFETYIACVSVHNTEEDQHGRLSMWRAYGDTALVVNNTPMTAVTDLLGVFSVPVLYLSEEGLKEHLSKITDAILINRTYLKGLGQDALVGYIYQMAFRFAIGTKHPGFKEEQEWRLFYRPTQQVSLGMSEETVVLGGLPQKVYKLRLANDPENGLHGADIPSLLDRVIVGPTAFSYVSYAAFVDVLLGLGVEDAHKKVVVSDIPLRVG